MEGLLGRIKHVRRVVDTTGNGTGTASRGVDLTVKRTF